MAELFVLLLGLTAAEESCSEEWRPSCVQPPRLRSGQPALGGDKEALYPPPGGQPALMGDKEALCPKLWPSLLPASQELGGRSRGSGWSRPLVQMGR